jgi:hypothetical protein
MTRPGELLTTCLLPTRSQLKPSELASQSTTDHQSNTFTEKLVSEDDASKAMPARMEVGILSAKPSRALDSLDFQFDGSKG